MFRSATLLALAVALLAAGCAEAKPGPNTVNGLVLVTEPGSAWRVDQTCAPAEEFKDLAKGTEVVVKDGSGKVLGRSTLPVGAGEQDDSTDRHDSETHICEYLFAVPGVATTKTYVVKVGDRPEVTVSQDDMKARFWTVSFEFPGPAPQ